MELNIFYIVISPTQKFVTIILNITETFIQLQYTINISVVMQ